MMIARSTPSLPPSRPPSCPASPRPPSCVTSPRPRSGVTSPRPPSCVTSRENGHVEMEMLMTPSPSKQEVALLERQQELADQELRRSIINSEFILFYGCEVDGYLPPLPEKNKTNNVPVPAWVCENPALRQLASVGRRSPRSIFPGQTHYPRRPVLLTPELRRPHTAVEKRVKAILNTKYARRPNTGDGRVESYTFRLSQPPKEEPQLIQPKKLQILDVERDVDSISIASSVPGRFRAPRFIKPGPKKKISKRHKTAAHQLLANQRAECMPRVLQGQLTELPQPVPTKVKIFLSATTQDFEIERQALHRYAYPRLREFCAYQGLDFELVDFPEFPGDVSNMEHQLEELEKCRKESYGPYFVTLLGDYSGPNVLPSQLPEEDYDLFAYVADHHNLPNGDLLQDFYLEDLNSNPNVYILQMDEVRGDNFPAFCQLFSKILLVAEHTGKITANTRDFYELKSATEVHIKKGIFDHKDIAALSALAFIRTFSGFSLQSEHAEIYTNLDKKGDVDEKLQERRSNIVQRLKHRLQEDVNAKVYTVPWESTKGCEEFDFEVESSHPDDTPRSVQQEHAAAIQVFVEDFVNGVKRLIESNKKRWSIGSPVEPVFNEVLHHSTVLASHQKVFTGRAEILEHVEAYLKFHKDRRASPLVIVGDMGAGKSAIVAAIASHTKPWLGDTTMTVARICGLTDRSTTITDVLVNLCLQICAIYNMEAPRVADRQSVNRMLQHFTLMLDLISKHLAKKKPLVILLDDIDCLTDADRAETLIWLPRVCPENVYIIVTVSSQSESTLQKLQLRLQTQNSIISIDPPDETETLSMIINYIKNSGRRLHEDQVGALSEVCKDYPEPAFIAALCRVALTWRSWTYLDNEFLPTGTEDALVKLKYSLLNGFGEVLTDRVLGYLCLSPHGITYNELRDAIASDEVVLEELLQERGDEPNLMTWLDNHLRKFMKELEPLLVERFKFGRTMLCWCHDHFRDIMYKWCFELEESVQDKFVLYQRRFVNLLQCDTPIVKTINGISINCETTPRLLLPCNLHPLHVIPKLLVESFSHEEAIRALKENCFCKFKCLLVKLQAVPARDVIADFNLVDERDPEIDLVKGFLKLACPALTSDPLTLPCQLLGCLATLDARDFPMVNEMLEDSIKYLEDTMLAVLVPLYPVFPSPQDVCKVKHWGMNDILQFDPSGKLAVTRTEAGYIEIWDVNNREVAYSPGAKFNRTTPNIFCTPEKVFAHEWPFAHLWSIESGEHLVEINLGDLLGGLISSIFVVCHDENLHLMAIHTSDEEFNQTIAILNLTDGSLLHQIKNFDVKDEFFSNAAYFVDNSLVFVSARSQLMDDGKTTDYVKMKVFDMEKGEVIKEIKCGVKKFSSLVPKKDGKCLCSWQDCSFDVYDISHGNHSRHLAAPDSELQLHQSFLTTDASLVALASTDKYYALWCWQADSRSPVQLVSQTYSHEEEVPHQCIILEEIQTAILATPDTALIAIWNLPNSACIATIKAHTEQLERLVRTPDPYSFYSCSTGEEVVKLWDIYDILKSAEPKTSRSSSLVLPSNPTGRVLESGILKRPGSVVKSQTPSRKSVRFAEDDHDDERPKEREQNPEEAPEIIPATNINLDFLQTEDAGTKTDNTSMVDQQMKWCKDVSCVDFANDSRFLVSGSDCGPPVVWWCGTGNIMKTMKPYDEKDIATPWVGLAVNEACIVGLTADEVTQKAYPRMYKYEVWSLESGEATLQEQDEKYRATACAIMHDKERAVLAYFEPDRVGEEVSFNVILIKDHVVFHHISFETEAIPTEMTITDENIYAVTNDLPEEEGRPGNTMVFRVNKDQDPPDATDSPKEKPKACAYQYHVGDKYREYRSAQCVLLSNGMALSSGLNGDMQIWDVATCEYEGNLYYDTTVKETRDPNLHNYGGKRVTHVAVADNGAYMICGIIDGSAVLWDLENDALCYTYNGHSQEVSQVAISWDNQLVLTASRDLTLCAWQFATPERPLARLFIYAVPRLLKISRDKRSVVAVAARKNEPAQMMMFSLRNTFTE